MAMLCSVTVSMGEETKGVLREIRFVTGESRVTSEAGKPGRVSMRGNGQLELMRRVWIAYPYFGGGVILQEGVQSDWEIDLPM